MAYSIVIPSRNIDNLLACVKAVRIAGEAGRVIVLWDDGATIQDDGHFIQFNGRLIPAKITGAGDIPVSVADIEDVVEGNIYDHEGAD
jgi:hypothetical protein